MEIYVVMWMDYDGAELLGASTDKEKAKEIKRQAVERTKRSIIPMKYNEIEIITVQDGENARG